MKEIQALLSGKGMTLDFKVIANELCEGCQQQVEMVEFVCAGGALKGQLVTGKRGCKCEERELARQALEARERAVKAKAIEIFQEKSLINEKLKQATLKNYTPRHQTQQEALQWAVDYCKGFDPNTSPNALLQGSYGLGKSHISVGIVRYLIKQGHTCIFTSVPKLFTKIKATYNRDSNTKEHELLEALEVVDLLVLDDLGAEQASEWQLSKLFEVIDTRAGKPTIYTTNHNSKTLVEQVGNRNFDRLMDNVKVLVLQGESYRKKAHEWGF